MDRPADSLVLPFKTAVVCILATQLWQHREILRGGVVGVTKSVALTLSGTGGIFAQSSVHPSAPFFAKSSNKRLDDIRLSVFLGTLRVTSFVIPVLCLLQITFRGYDSYSVAEWLYSYLLVGMFLVIQVILGQSGRLPVSAVYIFHFATMFVWTSRLFFVRNSWWILASSGPRLALRIFLTLPLLSTRYGLPMNIVYSLAAFGTIHRNFADLQQAIPTSGKPSNGPWLDRAELGLYVSEVVIFATIVAVCILAEEVAHGKVRDQNLTDTLDGVRHAVLKLLSVVCDDHVQLDSRSQIIAHSKAFSSSLTPGDRSSLEGSSIFEFIAAADRDRFREFLALPVPDEKENTPAIAATTPEPPTSIHLSLQSWAGGAIPVQLFCVSLPDHSGNQGRLLGVRHTASTLMEVEVDAPGVSPALRLATVPEEAAEVPGLEALEEPPRPEPGPLRPARGADDASGSDADPPHQAAGVEDGASDASSMSSAVREMQGYHHVYSVTFTVNTEHDRLLIDDMSLHFSQPGRSDHDNADLLPGLTDWLPKEKATAVREWVQSNTNALFCDKAEDLTDFGPMRLVCGKDEFIRAASIVAESIQDPSSDDASDSSSDASDKRNDLKVLLRLRGLSKVLWPPRRRPFSREDSVRGHKRSSSKRQTTCTTGGMPTIRESTNSSPSSSNGNPSEEGPPCGR